MLSVENLLREQTRETNNALRSVLDDPIEPRHVMSVRSATFSGLGIIDFIKPSDADPLYPEKYRLWSPLLVDPLLCPEQDYLNWVRTEGFKHESDNLNSRVKPFFIEALNLRFFKSIEDSIVIAGGFIMPLSLHKLGLAGEYQRRFKLAKALTGQRYYSGGIVTMQSKVDNSLLDERVQVLTLKERPIDTHPNDLVVIHKGKLLPRTLWLFSEQRRIQNSSLWAS